MGCEQPPVRREVRVLEQGVGPQALGGEVVLNELNQHLEDHGDHVGGEYPELAVARGLLGLLIPRLLP